VGAAAQACRPHGPLTSAGLLLLRYTDRLLALAADAQVAPGARREGASLPALRRADAVPVTKRWGCPGVPPALLHRRRLALRFRRARARQRRERLRCSGAQATIRDLQDVRTGALYVAASQTVGVYDMPRLVGAHRHTRRGRGPARASSLAGRLAALLHAEQYS
jgi:hypothetical protein